MAWLSSAGLDGASSDTLAVAVAGAAASAGGTSGDLLLSAGAGAVGVGGAFLALTTVSPDDKRADEDLDVLLRGAPLPCPGVDLGRRLLPDALRLEKLEEVEVVELAGEPLVLLLAKEVL